MVGDRIPDIGQLYRGQLSEANTWRARLDRTTNWAVVITGAVTTWAFTASERNHAVILLGMTLVVFFLLIEGRRYRHFEVWRERVRLIEEGYFTELLDPVERERDEWRRILARDLARPTHKISAAEAVGRRYLRIYIWILAVLYVAWLGKLWIQPTAAKTVGTVASRASIGPIPGGLLVTAITASLFALTAFSLYATWTREAKGELRPKGEKGEGWKE